MEKSVEVVDAMCAWPTLSASPVNSVCRDAAPKRHVVSLPIVSKARFANKTNVLLVPKTKSVGAGFFVKKGPAEPVVEATTTALPVRSAIPAP